MFTGGTIHGQHQVTELWYLPSHQQRVLLGGTGMLPILPQVLSQGHGRIHSQGTMMREKHIAFL